MADFDNEKHTGRPEHRTRHLASLGAGAAAAYLFDPTWGHRRRVVARDRLRHAAHAAACGMSKAARDLGNRTRGVVSAAAQRMRHDRADDLVLAERVRAALGRVVSHAHAIKADVRDGVVTLTGPILAAEEPALLSMVSSVRGVQRVENRLELHERPEHVPSLQGGPSRKPHRLFLDIRQRHWAPATRLLAGSAATAMIAGAATRRRALALPLIGAGTLLLARAATNLEVKRLLGVGAGRRAIDIQKTLTVHVPISELFAFWDHFPNFPQFMRHVREVRPTRDPALWHWVVSGPGQRPVEFDAVITERIPDRVLAWKTVEGSAVAHAGLVRFEAAGPGASRAQVRLSYHPPGGALGHGVLSLVGGDVKRRLNEDLVRMKTALETGRRAHDAAAPAPDAAHPADESDV